MCSGGCSMPLVSSIPWCFSAESSAELVRCASLDTPGTTISTKSSERRFGLVFSFFPVFFLRLSLCLFIFKRGRGLTLNYARILDRALAKNNFAIFDKIWIFGLPCTRWNTPFSSQGFPRYGTAGVSSIHWTVTDTSSDNKQWTLWKVWRPNFGTWVMNCVSLFGPLLEV